MCGAFHLVGPVFIMACNEKRTVVEQMRAIGMQIKIG